MKHALHILFIVQVALFTSFAAHAAGAKESKENPAIAISPDSQDLKWGPAPEFMPKGTQLAVLHGDPSKKNADVMIKFPAKSKIPSHWHNSAERMVLTAGKLQVKYEGQNAVVLTPGTYAYGPAKLKHEATCESDTPCILFIAFEEPVDALPVSKK